jgi:hypothetical protein
MMSKMLGAPLRGTTVGGQYGLKSLASMLIVPPNGAGGGGRYLPSIVVVASGEPGTPVICWAGAAAAAIRVSPVDAKISETRLAVLITTPYDIFETVNLICKPALFIA